MHRKPLLTLLADYRERYPAEAEVADRFTDFVSTHPECFERSLLIGHITGSAWIIDESGTQTLLTHHRKLNRWLQPGGHADGDPDVAAVALREAQEESGIQEVRLVHPDIFDIDVHTIPERKDVPEHLHWDVRFLIQAAHLNYVVSEESHDLAWVPMENIHEFSTETSMIRMRDKALRT